MQNRWFHPPTLHCPAPGKERKVGWLELFYDLIYVATIIQLGNVLSNNVGWLGVLGFAGLFTALWGTWTSFTFYSNRFVVDDVLHRGLVFVQMFTIGAMAVSVGAVVEGRPMVFCLAYAGARWVLVALYYRAWRHVPDARAMTRRYVLGFGVAAVFWTASAFVPWPWTFLLWGVAIGVDLFTPLSPASRELSARLPPDVLHMSERYGLLTIIVLGESFVKVLSEAAANPGDVGMLTMAAMGLAISCSLWWVYFDDVGGSRIRKGRLTPFVWIYTHLPLTIGVTAVGVAIKKTLHFELMAPAPTKYRWLLCGMLMLVLLTVAVLDAVTERRQSEMSDKVRVRMRVACAALVGVSAAVGGLMPSWAFITLVVVVMLGQVGFDLMMAPLAADPHAAHHDAQSIFDDVDTLRPTAPSGPVRTDVQDAVRVGTPDELRRDLYFHLMDGSWRRLFATLALMYLFLNVVFASLYLLEDGGVANLRPDSFMDAFAFSVQTLSTIGYGVMAPASPYAHALVAIEALVGMLGLAVFTGLVFAKASRPRSAVLFSEVCVVAPLNGQPTLMLRAGNARGNEIAEASVHLTVLLDEVTPEGVKLRRLHDLTIARERTPVFALSWTIMHVIDEHSPLRHLLEKGATEDTFARLLVTLTGHDLTYAQTVHARHTYYPEDVRLGHQFVDVISTMDDGRLMVDYTKFHRTAAVDGGPGAGAAAGSGAGGGTGAVGSGTGTGTS